MTFLVERLVELRRYLNHLQRLRTRIDSVTQLEQDLSLHNDVLFSLLMVCQLVMDIAGEYSARRGDRFEDYTEAVRNLRRDARFADEVVSVLERLPGFRNILIYEYVALDLERVVGALQQLEPVLRFLETATAIEAEREAEGQ